MQPTTLAQLAAYPAVLFALFSPLHGESLTFGKVSIDCTAANAATELAKQSKAAVGAALTSACLDELSKGGATNLDVLTDHLKAAKPEVIASSSAWPLGIPHKVIAHHVANVDPDKQPDALKALVPVAGVTRFFPSADICALFTSDIVSSVTGPKKFLSAADATCMAKIPSGTLAHVAINDISNDALKAISFAQAKDFTTLQLADAAEDKINSFGPDFEKAEDKSKGKKGGAKKGGKKDKKTAAKKPCDAIKEKVEKIEKEEVKEQWEERCKEWWGSASALQVTFFLTFLSLAGVFFANALAL